MPSANPLSKFESYGNPSFNNYRKWYSISLYTVLNTHPDFLHVEYAMTPKCYRTVVLLRKINGRLLISDLRR